MRVATWNIWWRFENFEERQPAILATLAGLEADIVGLQETWPEQVEWLASELGYEHRWSGAIPELRDPNPDRMPLGNAILSRHRIVADDFCFLDDGAGRQYRTVLGARVEYESGIWPFYSTHLNYRFDDSPVRQAQLREISEFVERFDPGPEYPAILVGDLNAVPDSDEIRRLTGRSEPYLPGRIWTDSWEHAGQGPGLTWADDNPYQAGSVWPNRRLDYVLVGWPRHRHPAGNQTRAEIFGTSPVDGVLPSDHYGVVVDLLTG